jgi:hypothetical protein
VKISPEFIQPVAKPTTSGSQITIAGLKAKKKATEMVA